MSDPRPPAAPPPASTPPFKSRYKLHGVITAVVVMWVAFAVIYRGLVTDDPGVVIAGMVVMLGATAVAYYFG